MAGRFRVEHLATKPAGYKVRTVTRGAHRVRIAFPPGRRKKGSGIPLEVLHPNSGTNQEGACRAGTGCRFSNPAELITMFANPAELVVMANPSEAERATRKYEEFHGMPSKWIDTVHEPTPRNRALAELADLLELRVKPDHGTKWISLNLIGKKVKLSSNAAGTQMYCIGGDQSMTAEQLRMFGADTSKEMIDLGEARYVAYRTRKGFTGGKLASHEHPLGEETGKYPRLVYDRRGSAPRLLFVGGEYRIEAPGIIN
jgi:hypothetical protein